MSFAPTKISLLPRSADSDLELIERVDQSLEVLQGKWKVHLLFHMARGIHRHSRLLACLPSVSKKVPDTRSAQTRSGVSPAVTCAVVRY